MVYMALESSQPVKSFLKEHTFPIIGGTLLILAIIPSVYFYSQYQKAQARLTNPTQYAEEEAKKLTLEVGKLITLPTDETPTVATVNDKEKLKNQPFFARSENGDKVLIFTNAKKAILYRPAIKKIIDVAPINIGGSATESAVLATQEAKITFVLRNGTTTVGLTRSFETKLKAAIPNADVTDRDNAKKTTYATSFLVDVEGTNAGQAQEIATKLGIPVEPFPAGESTPSSDFLIILGTDKK